MELIRVDEYKKLVKDTDALIVRAQKQSKQMFDVIERLLIDELKSFQKNIKNLKPEQILDFINRAENYKAIQKRVNAKTKSYLDSFLSNYKQEIQNLKNLYGKNFNDVGITKYFDKVKELVNLQTDVYSLFTQNQQNIKILSFANNALLFNTQTDVYINAISQSFNKSFSQSKTILGTSQKAVFTKVRQDYYSNLNIKEKKYLYIGPDDSITRDFCAEYVGQIKTEDEWKAIDNDQLGSVWDTMGGYNCRHQLILVQSENFKG